MCFHEFYECLVVYILCACFMLRVTNSNGDQIRQEFLSGKVVSSELWHDTMPCSKGCCRVHQCVVVCSQYRGGMCMHVYRSMHIICACMCIYYDREGLELMCIYV